MTVKTNATIDEELRVELIERSWKSLATLLNLMEELGVNPTLPTGYEDTRITGHLGRVRWDEAARKWVAETTR